MKTTTPEPHGPVARRAGASSGPWPPPAAGRGGAA